MNSRYKYSAATIPFMGMVLHGYKEYSGAAINLAGDYQYTLLKSIESGASPYFVIAIDNTAELKQKEDKKYLSKYYSVRYNIWYSDIVNTYKTLNDTLKDLKYTAIVKHEFIDSSNKVPKVTYENGTEIYLNYLLDEYTVKIGSYSVAIPAESFIKVNKVDNNEKVISVVFEDGSRLFFNGTDSEYEVKVADKTIKIPAGNSKKVDQQRKRSQIRRRGKMDQSIKTNKKNVDVKPATPLKQGKKRKVSSLQKQKSKMGWLFIAPFLIGFVIIYLPMIAESIYFSFCKMKTGASGYVLDFIGLENYRYAILSDKYFLDYLGESVLDLLFQIPAIVIFSLFVAVLLNEKMKGRAVFRAIFFIPLSFRPVLLNQSIYRILSQKLS
jgi:uncharacterized membrane protein